MSVTNHTLTSKYEQEVLYHLNEIYYWDEVAKTCSEELRLALSRQKYHQDELEKVTEEPSCA